MKRATLRAARNWLAARDPERPFFLWLASTDPHRPHTEGKAFQSRYNKNALALPEGFVEGKGVRAELLAYYLEVSSFDEDVGRVIDALDANGHLENTLVIVMSDNGRPFTRAKQMLYDDGIKTPFIIYWPEGMGEPGEYSKLISAVDIAPTILELAGADSATTPDEAPATSSQSPFLS